MWLPIFWFLIVLAGVAIAYLTAAWLPAFFASVIILVGIVWVLGCVFSPAVPDRRCPRCGKDGLVKIRKGEPLGVRCEQCNFVDEGKYVAYLDEW